MLKIRLKRTGKKHEPHYRVVVIESSKPRNSKAVAEIGYYNPRNKPSTFDLDKEAAKKWIDNGAQPSDTVAHYLVKEGIMEKPKFGSTKPKGKTKKKAEEANEE